MRERPNVKEYNRRSINGFQVIIFGKMDAKKP